MFSFFCNMCIFFMICPCISCCLSHIFHLCCVILFTPVAVIVQSSLLYNRVGRARVLYNFILAFCGLNILFVMPVIFRYLCHLLSLSSLRLFLVRFPSNCPLNGLQAQSRVSSVADLLPLAAGQACFWMAFTSFLWFYVSLPIVPHMHNMKFKNSH
jgi:hypothetical protein